MSISLTIILRFSKMLRSFLVGICWSVPRANYSQAPCGPALLVVEAFNDSLGAFSMATFCWRSILKRLACLAHSSVFRRKASTSSAPVSILRRVVNEGILELPKVIIIKEEGLSACLIP